MSEQFRKSPERLIPEEIDLAASEFMRLFYHAHDLSLLRLYMMKPLFYRGEDMHADFLAHSTNFKREDIVQLHADFTKIIHEYCIDPTRLRNEIFHRIDNN